MVLRVKNICLLLSEQPNEEMVCNKSFNMPTITTCSKTDGILDDTMRINRGLSPNMRVWGIAEEGGLSHD